MVQQLQRIQQIGHPVRKAAEVALICRKPDEAVNLLLQHQMVYRAIELLMEIHRWQVGKSERTAQHDRGNCTFGSLALETASRGRRMLAERQRAYSTVGEKANGRPLTRSFRPAIYEPNCSSLIDVQVYRMRLFLLVDSAAPKQSHFFGRSRTLLPQRVSPVLLAGRASNFSQYRLSPDEKATTVGARHVSRAFRVTHTQSSGSNWLEYLHRSPRGRTGNQETVC